MMSVVLPKRAILLAARAALETVLAAECPVCRGPLGSNRAGVCRPCWGEAFLAPGRQESGGRFVDSVTTLGPYEGRLRGIVRCLKYSGMAGLGAPLGAALASRLGREPIEIDVVVPVPLHWRRRWRRGYNQAEEIARSLARSIDRPVDGSLLRRRRFASRQTGRDRRQRLANVRGAFGGGRPGCDGLRVLLVDDVVTTGATARECGRELKRAGAVTVHVAAVARTPIRIET